MKLSSAICAPALMLAGTGTADATTYAPAGTYIFKAPVFMSKEGLALNCAFKIAFTVPEAAPDAHSVTSHGHSATAVPLMLAPSSPLCSAISFYGTPYAASFSGTDLALTGVFMSFPTSSTGCSGTISSAWNNPLRTMAFDVTLPDHTGTSPCRIVGTLRLVSGTVSITNP